jgi:hypothetical protein
VDAVIGVENPESAERDIRIPLEPLERYGHGDLGIYPRPMPGPMMAQLAKLFLRLCELKKLKRHP